MGGQMVMLCLDVDASSTQKGVLNALAARYNERTGQCNPSIGRMQLDTGYSDRAICNALSELEEGGHLKIVRNSGCKSSYLLHPQVHKGRHAQLLTPEPASGVAGHQPPNLLRGSIQEPPKEVRLPPKEVRDSNRKNRNNELLNSVILPFTSTGFANAWQEWEQHLKEKRKPLTPSCRSKQLKKAQGWGEARAIAAINFSIEKNYQGLFEEPDYSRNQQHQGTKPPPGISKLNII
ncbi:helix-turn-helix domain-containing protein [Verrucomicrobium spinosum]|uniref:helix-turn-helix domain-containing protein n=1 Tax=Verrucomicrobium spinosum TaxID=2736 RepID=UPI0004923A20